MYSFSGVDIIGGCAYNVNFLSSFGVVILSETIMVRGMKLRSCIHLDE